MKDGVWWALAVVIAGITVTFDLVTPRGVAGGVPYVLLVLVGYTTRSPKIIYGLAALATGLTIAGALVSPPEVGELVFVSNRILAVVLICASAYAVHRILVSEDRQEAQLKRLNAVIETAVDGVVIIDEKGIVERFNPACIQLFGYDASEVIGLNINMLMPAPYKKEHDGYLKNYLKTGERKIIGIGRQVEGLRKNGSTFPMEVSVGEARHGEQKMFVGIIRDITEHVRSQREIEINVQNLKRSNQELERFAYVASHDLQEPLRKIQTFGDRLRERYAQSLDARALDYLDRMQNAGGRMTLLIEDLLNFSRVSTKDGSFEPTDLGDLVAGVLDDLEVLIEETSARVSVERLPTLDVDRSQCRQLFQNLITNAIKYRHVDRAPEIVISSELLSGTSNNPNGFSATYLIEVRDNGIGFSNEYADKIFQIFQRLHGREEYKGTGVGLATARRIAERHGGSIRAEGFPNEGATFFVTLKEKHDDREHSPNG
ncbi:MAG: PAS domain S-box protein [Opitutales bacterium]|jgi:two-component system, LuxR family, sensor kinase FixL|nr:PAS domain S-box protein [Opitutales bacterium]